MTQEEYKALVDEYCKTMIDDEDRVRWTLFNRKILSRSEKIDKWPVEWNARDIYDFYTQEMCLSSASASNRLSTMWRFYDYMISKGVIASNPCAEQFLTARAIVEHTQSLKNYYTDDDIDYIIDHLEFNLEMNTAVLLTYYEGVAIKSVEVENLKLSGFHPENNTIITARGVKTISQRLSDAYRQLVGLDYLIGDMALGAQRVIRRKTKVYKLDRDSLFPTTSSKFSVFMNRRLTNIGDSTGYHLNPYDLYYSGFLNYVSRKVGVQRCLNLVFSWKNEGYKELCEYADEYLFQGQRDKMRGALRNTALAMQEYYS